MGSADADVVEAAVDPEGEFAVRVDAVGAHAVVAVAAGIGVGCGFRPGVVGGGRGCLIAPGAVWSAVVVVVDEAVEQGLQVGDGDRRM